MTKSPGKPATRSAVSWNPTSDFNGSRARSAKECVVWPPTSALQSGRVDPDHEVNLRVDDATLDEALQHVGRSIGGGVSYVGAVVYIGSEPVTTKLATLAAQRRDEVKKLPAAARTRFSMTSEWTWAELSTPRELLSQLANAANADVVNIEMMPHDLWAAGDFPAMPLTDRMTLLLAGFDLTFEIARDGSAIRLGPMPSEVVIERKYLPRGTLKAATTMIRSEFPEVGIRTVGARLAITAKFEEHQAIDRLLHGEPVRRAEPAAGVKRFDLRVDNQLLGAIIKVIADREMLRVRVDPSVQAKLQQRVSFDAKQLTLDELLDRALMSARIAHRVADGVLELGSR